MGVVTPERRKMPENKKGKRIGLYINEELLARCDAAIGKTNTASRSEFICDAVEHYIAVLSARDTSKVLTPALESVIGGKIAGTEDRLSRIIFKLGVEIAMMNNIIAATHRFNVQQLDELRETCTQEVARITGGYRMEDACRMQRRE